MLTAPAEFRFRDCDYDVAECNGAVRKLSRVRTALSKTLAVRKLKRAVDSTNRSAKQDHQASEQQPDDRAWCSPSNLHQATPLCVHKGFGRRRAREKWNRVSLRSWPRADIINGSSRSVATLALLESGQSSSSEADALLDCVGKPYFVRQYPPQSSFCRVSRMTVRATPLQRLLFHSLPLPRATGAQVFSERARHAVVRRRRRAAF